jgi:hypothetical protein
MHDDPLTNRQSPWAGPSPSRFHREG